MSFECAPIRRALEGRGVVWRVLVAGIRGSVPREVGASMLVWPGGQSGTIGGGTLEFEAAARAPMAGSWDLRRIPLGPDLGQCCGGAVSLLTERWDAARLAALEARLMADGCAPAPLFARGPGPGPVPPGVLRRMRRAAAGHAVAPGLVEGWMVEPFEARRRPVWIHGAGHVGHALCAMLAPLPGLEITWIDARDGHLPAVPPAGVRCLVGSPPDALLRTAPPDAAHFVMTHSHALDLEICHELLTRGFGSAGLIGSATKWARFRRRLEALGHAPERIERITCPIGDPSLGKDPQAIAIGVAASLVKEGRAGVRPVPALVSAPVQGCGTDRTMADH